MKIVYIAHPIAGDIDGNLIRISAIIRMINLTYPEVVPFAHYFVDIHSLDDRVEVERNRGIKNDITFLKAGFINEMWLFGDKVSNGMQTEIKL